MNIHVTISLGPDDDVSVLPGNATTIADSVLTAAGGDPSKDTCSVTIQDSGLAGPGANTASQLPAPPPPVAAPPAPRTRK